MGPTAVEAATLSQVSNNFSAEKIADARERTHARAARIASDAGERGVDQCGISVSSSTLAAVCAGAASGVFASGADVSSVSASTWKSPLASAAEAELRMEATFT